MLRPLSLGLLALCGTLWSEVLAYEISQNATNHQRKEAIDKTREEFLYGPAVAGGPFYPTGPQGRAKVAADIADVQRETTPNTLLVQQDVARAGNSSEQVSIFPTMVLLSRSLMTHVCTVSRSRHSRRIPPPVPKSMGGDIASRPSPRRAHKLLPGSFLLHGTAGK